MKNNFFGQKVAILGYGVNNAELVPFLLARGAQITICDKNPDLAKKVEGVEYRLGPDYLNKLDDFDIVFRTPGIPFLAPEIQAAYKAGDIITSQTQLFMEEAECKIIGVTGTKGKGTTASIIESILKAAAKRKEINGEVYIAGNIGASPIHLLDKLKVDDWVILELSSFQLQDLTVSPHIAVILNVTTDHLDYHKSVEEYRDAKSSIVRYQTGEDFAVICHDYEGSMSYLDATHATPFFFSRLKPVDAGAYIDNDQLVLRMNEGKVAEPLSKIDELPLVGAFNLENAAAACVAASLAGASVAAVKEGLLTFRGLRHRLEFVAEKNGVKYYDDSKATTPDSTIAAIESFTQPSTLIVGGVSKGADYTELAKALTKISCQAVICIGEAGPTIKELLQKNDYAGKIIDGAKTMPAIVAQAKEITPLGGVVVLSPAGASFDMFKNAEDRGTQFQEAVKKL